MFIEHYICTIKLINKSDMENKMEKKLDGKRKKVDWVGVAIGLTLAMSAGWFAGWWLGKGEWEALCLGICGVTWAVGTGLLTYVNW